MLTQYITVKRVRTHVSRVMVRLSYAHTQTGTKHTH